MKTLNQILKLRKDLSREEKKKIKEAYRFARKAHKGQRFDGQKYSYFIHPAFAGYLMAKWGRNWEEICAAVLHDVVEDCGISLNAIKKKFGQRIAFLVDGMSWELKWNSKEKRYLKDWDGFFKKICRYAKEDVAIILLHCADERSKLKDITGKEFKKIDENPKRTKKRLVRYLAFYIPLYKKLGLKSHAKFQFERLYKIVKENPKSKLFEYVSEKDLMKIKEKIIKIKGIEELR